MAIMCVCLAVIEFVVAGVILGFRQKAICMFLAIICRRPEAHSRHVDTNNPADGVFVCAAGDPPGTHFLGFSWLPVFITESILMCLSLYKGWQNRRADYGGCSALRMLTRDSIIYFMAYVDHHTHHRHARADIDERIFWVYLLNQFLWFINIVSPQVS